MSYKHLTLEERYHIQAYKEAGYLQKEIARKLNVSPATISRELKRNSTKVYKKYTAKKADQVANDKRKCTPSYHVKNSLNTYSFFISFLIKLNIIFIK